MLLGLMLSRGSSNLISQGASGLILTFSKTFRIGEYVKIGDHEGTVSALGMFSTRLRTGMGEELTLANASVFSSVIRNYSRTTEGESYILDTTVTIGYDTPWRQVEAMLLEAAPGIPDRTVGFLSGIPSGLQCHGQTAAPARRSIKRSACQHPGCVQPIRRADHVATLL